MARTIRIYRATIEAPNTWTLVVDGIDEDLGVYGWLYEDPGVYRFRVEVWENGERVEWAITNWVSVGRDRSLTPEMKALLGARQMSMRTWLFVEDGDGEMIDRSSFLTGYEIRYHLDSIVGTASVRIRREHYGTSIAPALDTSPANRTQGGEYSPAIEVGRKFTIWVAQTAIDAEPSFEHDAYVIFCGMIDEHDFSSSDANFGGRDIFGRLADTWIEEVQDYGAPDPGVPATEVVQQLIDDHAQWEDRTTVYVPYEIDVQLGLRRQEYAYLLETARQYAMDAGAELRGLWRDTTSQFALTMYQADRLPTDAHYSFSPHEWFEMVQLRVANTNVVNALAGSYMDDDGDIVEADLFYDQESIDKFGRRWARVDLRADSLVRSASAYEAFARSFLQALSEPDEDLEIRTRMFWPAGLNRYYEFQADGLRFNASRTYACQGYRHVYARGSGSMDDTFDTFVLTRGKAAGGRTVYLQRTKAPNVPVETPENPPPPPPPPASMRITAANYGEISDLDFPQLIVPISWAVVNPEPGASISIDREMSATGIGNWVNVVSGELPNGGPWPDVFTIPGSTEIRWRVRLVVDGSTVLTRYTGYASYVWA